ncbi:uncharacterized protein N7483_012092 [Penicillium malachiteum]|uniref:uncharacterized protein n=1 Tax=Penicillium malachiteum TaxID=1324776 RepID=UPI0025480623|nr:uncharacterized protein N7483_012092 [Penicillium malachiteum]KAJ5714911.1 hypothetical protein N7483_012092 [Penicillium malachiteum]
MGYIAPSMTPTSDPPSFRVYDIDSVTFGVLDFTQYIANISDPPYQIQPEWVPYYSAKADYGTRLEFQVTDKYSELTPAFWHNVTVAMEKHTSLFRDFWARRTRGFQFPECEGDCTSNEICALKGADAQYNCFVEKIGFSFEKRSDKMKVEWAKDWRRLQPECNHAGMAPLLAKIAYQASLVRE